MLEKPLVYTFRTYPYVNELRKYFSKVHILSQIKKDLDKIFKEIKTSKPYYILGIADSGKQKSRFEPSCINRFNKTKKIAPGGKESFPLSIPKSKKPDFDIARNATDSFCNYSMYKISFFLYQKNLIIPFYFIHLDKKDVKKIPILLDYISV